jgi:hypothetical protein
MEIQAKQSVTLPSITFFAVFLVAAMGWVVVLVQLLEHQEGLNKHLIEIGLEVLKVLVIAVAAAIAVERLLQREPDEDPRAALRNVGIKEIYPKRQDAGKEFLRLVRDENIRRITISGISLRDFLPANGTLHEVWRDVCDRMKREEAAGVPVEQRLHVRFLVLLPNSDEGTFRHEVEGENQRDPGGIPFDIPNALSQVRNAQQEIFGTGDTPYLQVRLYEHCPFAFVFATESDVFVEQYDYRDQSKPAALPILDYQSGTAQYREQMFSLEVIWKHARPAEFVDAVGTATAIREARLKNIFRRDHRTRLTKQQATAIRAATGESIDILAISGHFYVSNPNVAPELQRISRAGKLPSGEDCPAVPIRVAVINPVCQQAILRAVADASPPELVGKQLRSWTWENHQQSDLYKDARKTANTLYSWNKQMGCRIHVKVYSSSIACMILQTDEHAFIEQYMYGRSKAFQVGFNLGGEYPVLEFDVSKVDGKEMVEHQVIAATFEIIWNFYSVPWEHYVTRDEKVEFELNLARLLEELSLPPSTGGDAGTGSENGPAEALSA